MTDRPPLCGSRSGGLQSRVGVAVASGALAAGGAVGERAGQDEADLAEFGLDLLVRRAGSSMFPASPTGAGERSWPGWLEVDIIQVVLAGDGPDAGTGVLAGRTGPALRGLSRFAAARGIPPGREFLLDYDVIEAFCVARLPGRASSTRGTYRSALYQLARPVHGGPGQRGTPFAGATPPPYSPGDRAELAAIAAAQPDPAKRRSALAMVVFGAGAGLRPGELRRCAAATSPGTARAWQSTLTGRPRGWRRSPQVMPAPWELARRADSDFVFRPGPADRGYKNFVTNFARTLAAYRAAPRLTAGRSGPVSSAATWPRAPRRARCWRSPGSARLNRWPATHATSKAPRPRPCCGPGTRPGRRAEMDAPGPARCPGMSG